MRKINKRGLEFSFAWMFAIVAGAVIIFLAIYGVTKLIGSEKEISQTEAGKALAVLLNPVETSVESAKISRIVFPVQTRLYNECSGEGNFGSQKVSVAEKSGFGETWTEPGVPTTMHNKYIFSEGNIEGKEFMVFSKPFYMPYKVADLIFMWPKEKEYCFVQPPTGIRDEIEGLNPGNINVTDEVGECRKGSTIVCFSASGCDIDVSMGASEISGSVKKGFDSVYYEGSLIYAAIFSSKELYECQVQRLMKRTSELASLYASKSGYVSGGGCSSSSVGIELLRFANSTKIDDSSGLRGIASAAEDIGRQNENLECRLF